MTDEIERLKQQHKEELDLAQEVIVNLRRDLANAYKRIESQDAVWNDAIEIAAVDAERLLIYADTTSGADKAIPAYIRSNKRPLA